VYGAAECGGVRRLAVTVTPAVCSGVHCTVLRRGDGVLCY
jgi:hypothetical protein